MNQAAPAAVRSRFDPAVLKALAGLQFRARYIVEGFLSGMHESPFHGYSAEFSEYRDYHPGDDLRHLDWRYYARADRLCIKRFEQETNLHFHVICDTSNSMAYQGSRAWGSKLEVASTFAASLAWLLLKQKDAVGLLTRQIPAAKAGVGELSRAKEEAQLHYLKPSQKPSQFGQIIRDLGVLEPAGGPCLEILLEKARRLIPRRGVILLISDFLDPSGNLPELLKHLRFLGHEIIVFQTLDPDELDFSFEDTAIFEDLENGDRRRIRVDRVKETYLQRFEAFLEENRRMFRALEISHTVMPTDADPGRALAFFLSQRKLFT